MQFCGIAEYFHGLGISDALIWIGPDSTESDRIGLDVIASHRIVQQALWNNDNTAQDVELSNGCDYIRLGSGAPVLEKEFNVAAPTHFPPLFILDLRAWPIL